MSYSSSATTIKIITNYQVVLQLVKFWLTTAEEKGSQLISEYTLFKLAGIEPKVSQNKQSEVEPFFFLNTEKFGAFLRIERIAIYRKYQITITLDPVTIVRELIQIGHQNQWNNIVNKYIQTHLKERLNFSDDNSGEFIVKAMKLLLDEKKTEHNHIFYTDPPMDTLLHYQVEQERIFEQIKIQIAQNLSLSEIIQTAIDRSRDFLKSDRLVIYQLNVPLKSDLVSGSVKTVDTVTYEAKTESVGSTLYFQEDTCWRKSTQCQSKYQQGFSLAIDDVEQNHHLKPCLRSIMKKFKIEAEVVAPINVGGELWGLIIAHQCSSPRHWQHEELEFLRQMAEYIAIAVHHHQSYQQLQQQKDILEQQVQTQAQQIKDALIAAEAASQSKHEFLGSMSHELRTPLTCVIGLSSTLLQWSSTKSAIPLSPEKQQQYLKLIQQSGKHLLSLINNILEFSDVESGKHLLNVRQISLVDIVRQSLHAVRETATDKEITLSSQIELETDREYFYADEIRLKEILFNLLSNGIKFTPDGGEVILRVWREKRQVVFQVEDTGIGIAPSEIPLLFEKFKQIENFKHRTQGGTGLGLALTKKLVELHGGNIEVESALDRGSLFTVSLPVKTPSVLNAKPTALTKNLANSTTIMLVTKNEENATFMCQLLNTIDCQVIWLVDSMMAINQIELLQPELIIVDRDFGLIEINNITRAIKKSPQADNISLMVLGDREFNPNCDFSKESEQQFARSRVCGYLSKTMNPSQIVNKVNSIITRIKEGE